MRRVGSAGPKTSRNEVMLESCLRQGFPSMPDADTRQKAETHYYAALDLMADGKLEEAVTAYRESLTVDPGFTEAMHGLARALQDLQRYDEAIAVAQQITELDPDDVLAHTSLSVLYQKKGMVPEAEAEGAKARVLGWKQQLKGKAPSS
jgi:tetratricopeptide (TPR) repeat protein